MKERVYIKFCHNKYGRIALTMLSLTTVKLICVLDNTPFKSSVDFIIDFLNPDKTLIPTPMFCKHESRSPRNRVAFPNLFIHVIRGKALEVSTFCSPCCLPSKCWPVCLEYLSPQFLPMPSFLSISLPFLILSSLATLALSLVQLRLLPPLYLIFLLCEMPLPSPFPTPRYLYG